MKMLEDLAEVMKRVNRTDCEEYALRYVEFFDEHGATIRDMAARLEAAERDAHRYERLKYDTKIFENYWAEEYLPGEEIDARVDQLIGPDAAMQETGR